MAPGRRFNSRWLWILATIAVVTHGTLILTGTTYVYKAIWYQRADIDDYQIFENRSIEAGTAQPWPLSLQYNQHKLTDEQSAYWRELGSIALLAVRHDSLLFEQYWDSYGPNSYSSSFSMAKSIVSLLVGIALEEGKIKSLDDAASLYVPEMRGQGKDRISIRHLLSMSSGLNWDEAYGMLFSNTTDAYYGNDLRALIGSLKAEKEPGTEFRYKSGDTQILQLVLEAVTGKRISEYFSEKIWSLVGAEHDALWSLDHTNGTEKAYCCVNSNARDFARIGQLVLREGQWNGRQLVPAQYLKQALSPNLIKDVDGDTCDYYGYQWWLTQFMEHEVKYARGILGQYIIIVPDLDLVIVRLGTERGQKLGHHFEETFKMIEFFSH